MLTSRREQEIDKLFEAWIEKIRHEGESKYHNSVKLFEEAAPGLGISPKELNEWYYSIGQKSPEPDLTDQEAEELEQELRFSFLY
jgi:hypothetical protein